MSLAEFAVWFEDESSAAYDNPDVREACSAVDAAFSAYYYDRIGEPAFRDALACIVAEPHVEIEWIEDRARKPLQRSSSSIRFQVASLGAA